MNFFQTITGAMAPNSVLRMEIIPQNDGRVTVLCYPEVPDLGDPAAQCISPIRVTGTAEELDEGFLQAITAPIEKTTGLLVNMKEVEDSIKVAESKRKKTEAAKKAEEAAKKAEDEKTTKEIKDLIAEGTAAANKGEFKSAEAKLKDAKQKAIDAKMVHLFGKLEEKTLEKAVKANETPSIFDMGTEEAQEN